MFCGIKNIRHSMNLIQKQKKTNKKANKQEKIKEWELMKSARYLSLAFVIKHIS